MKVFISYSREDEAITHLLAHILRSHRIECLLDRDLEAGRRFDSDLAEMIRAADLVLVLLTKNASGSAWVNQEIGYAVACGKTVWPLAIDTDIQPYGMLSMTQAYSLLDWSDPTASIERLVTALQKGVSLTSNPYRQFGFDHVIEGKTARTRFIVERLRELSAERSQPLVILNQAGFSIFAVSGDPVFRQAFDHPADYMELLLAEREALDELVRLPNCRFKMIVWPIRAYDDRGLALRYDNLLTWMDEVIDLPSVEYVCARYEGPNRLIVMGELLIEGYKLHHHPGYEMTVVKYQRERIDEAAAAFHQTFGRAGQDKPAARRRVAAMRDRALAGAGV